MIHAAKIRADGDRRQKKQKNQIQLLSRNLCLLVNLSNNAIRRLTAIFASRRTLTLSIGERLNQTKQLRI